MKSVNKNALPGGSKGPAGDIRSWLKLLAGLALIILFMFILAPLGDRLPGFDSMFKFIEERNLRATALYYTDIDEFGDASATLRNHLEYPNQSE